MAQRGAPHLVRMEEIRDLCRAIFVFAVNRTEGRIAGFSPEDHHPLVLAGAAVDHLLAQIARGDQEPVDLLQERVLDGASAGLGFLPVGIEQDRVVFAFLGLGRNRAKQIEIVGVVKVVDHQTDQVRAAARQNARGDVGAVAKLLRDRNDLIARLAPHPRGIGKTPRHGRQRHARRFRHILCHRDAVCSSRSFRMRHGVCILELDGSLSHPPQPPMALARKCVRCHMS